MRALTIVLTWIVHFVMVRRYIISRFELGGEYNFFVDPLGNENKRFLLPMSSHAQ